MSRKILVVDDDPVVGIIVNEYLAAQGYVVEVLRSGPACLEKLRSNLPDILLLDLIMPEMSGMEVLKNIRTNSRTKNLPVIMMSADSHLDSLFEDGDATPDRFVEKPFDMPKVVEVIESLPAKK